MEGADSEGVGDGFDDGGVAGSVGVFLVVARFNKVAICSIALAVSDPDCKKVNDEGGSCRMAKISEAA